jgi:hypothetical protein
MVENLHFTISGDIRRHQWKTSGSKNLFRPIESRKSLLVGYDCNLLKDVLNFCQNVTHADVKEEVRK